MTVVLAPIDGSARALRAAPWAARLAGSEGTVVLFRAVPPEPSYAEAIFSFAGGGREAVARIRDEWAALARADLEEAAALIAASGVAIEQAIAEGEPDEAIVNAARERGVDMITMASHGRGAIGRAIFGSVADRVARTATVPVLILRVPDDTESNIPPEVRRIVVPLDGSDLAAQALPVAAAVSRKLDAPVQVIRAVEPTQSLPISPATLEPAPSVGAEIADRLWQETQNAARETVQSAVATLQAEGIEASGSTLYEIGRAHV